MDVESVKSGRSDRSRHSQSASSRNVIRRPHSSHHIHHQSTRAAGRLAGEPHLRYGLESDTDRDDRSSRISRRHRHHMVDSGHEKITMRLFDDPLDDVTVITGATSEFAYSLEDLRKDPQIIGKKTFSRTLCSKFVGFCGSMLVFLLCLGSFVSPVIMVILPKIPALDWEVDNCDPECESALLGIGFKLLILLVATWALFFRNGRASLPRLDPAKALVIFITFLLTFSFWLFYTVRFFQALTVTYLGVVLFASSLVDSLLFIHYLAVILFELKQLKNRFAVKIVRSPDGASRTYAVGQMTVQNLAVWCLDKYYADFQSYNPYLEILPKKSSGASGAPAFKLYDVDGLQGPAGDDKIGGGRSFSVASSSANGGRAGHNDRFYGEQEYERRVLRRRSRLQASAEEAFAHLKRIRADSGESINVDCDAGQSFRAAALHKPFFPVFCACVIESVRECLKHLDVINVVIQ